MHQLIVTPFLGNYLVLRPGNSAGMKLPERRYAELLKQESDGAQVPSWLAVPVRRQWGVDLAGRTVKEAIIVRERGPEGMSFGRASYELNMFCNWECPHCYLGQKDDVGLEWDNRSKLLHLLRDAGVVWLQITGGEPTVDRCFPAVYSLAYDLGMMIEVLTNGSRLHHPLLLDVLSERRPYRMTLSLYGATEATYDRLTQRKGSWKSFRRGLDAALGAGLPVEFSIVVTRDNEQELDAMHALADSFGVRTREYNHMTPTYFGTGETLTVQALARGHRQRSPFTGCDAGHTSLHVDPLGMASICKVARDKQIPLLDEGLTGLAKLGEVADQALLRQGGCSGCQLSEQCSTCMPLAQRYRQSSAPLGSYCQHTAPQKEVSTP